MDDSRTGPRTVPNSPEGPYNSHMTNNQPNFDRFSFAAIRARTEAPADYATDMKGGDFDDYFTADDYDRRRYERECRRARYGSRF